MNERIPIKGLREKIGKEATLKGWISTRRDQGKLVFFDVRDYSGDVQVVALPKGSAIDTAKLCRQEFAVKITGNVNARPEKNISAGKENGDIEIEATKIEILAKSEPLPLDLNPTSFEYDLNTQLDNRALLLRHERLRSIFKVQSVVIDSFREYLKGLDFFEFQSPAIVPATAEGGAEVFELKYFEHKAYLSQSPQLYKQIAVSAFERVFSVNKVFRAEPSSTTRHLTEIVSLDAEIAFIDSWTDIRDLSEQVVKYVIEQVQSKCSKELEYLKVELPQLPKSIPTISLTEAQELIFKETGKDSRGEKDLNPEDERSLCAIIKTLHESDFVYVYGYPTRMKPFYVYPSENNPIYNEGVDLLCRGVEWLSGGRRINDYNQLRKHAAEWGLDESKISMYLSAFKYGVPPEGGFAFGAERMTMQLLNLSNIREAVMFPRDMNRIDDSLKKI